MKPPFKMLPHRAAALVCDGKHVVSGRASFVWETFLMRRAAGVPGDYAIRRGERGAPLHDVDLSIEEAEAELEQWGRFAAGRLRRARRTRAAREKRGLPVG